MNAAMRDGVIQGGIRQDRVGASAVVTVDRGGALNALTPAMLARLAQCYPEFARDPNLYVVVLKSADPKAFSAGGDVRALSAVALHDLPQACHDLAAEYRLNWLHECFSKPTVVLIDGLVMGSGVGISAYATHRVAGRGYRFAMPETAIGFFPDIGMAHALARMPHQIGTYLGLTGATIGRADAYALGLATHCIDSGVFGEVEARLADAWPVDPELDGRHVDPGPGDLAARSGTIAQCFAPDSIEEILRRLDAVTGADRDFAQATRADLEARAPLALKVTLRHLRRSAVLDLRQTLEADYRLACRFLAGPDFREGVRAALIDKDHTPRWMPAHLADVTANMLDDMFAPLPPERELNLPLRQDMQSMRV
jgi:enoyl-CoA hydratase